MSILQSGFYKLKSDLSLDVVDEHTLKLIKELKEEEIEKMLETISVIATSDLIDRDIDMFKMHYGIGYNQLYTHKLIVGKYKLEYKISHYTINKIMVTFKRYLFYIKSEQNLNRPNKKINPSTGNSRINKYLREIKETILYNYINFNMLPCGPVILKSLTGESVNIHCSALGPNEEKIYIAGYDINTNCYIVFNIERDIDVKLELLSPDRVKLLKI